MSKYCACVVWYKPQGRFVENIMTYSSSVDRVYVVDNTGEGVDNEHLLPVELREKCNYINLEKNRGLSFALNRACEQAIEDGYDYVLTMDQDSRFAEGAVDRLIEFEENHLGKYAIVCPNPVLIHPDEQTGVETIYNSERGGVSLICLGVSHQGASCRSLPTRRLGDLMTPSLFSI